MSGSSKNTITGGEQDPSKKREMSDLLISALLPPSPEKVDDLQAYVWIPVIRLTLRFYDALSQERLDLVAFVRYLASALLGVLDVWVFDSAEDGCASLNPQDQLHERPYFVRIKSGSANQGKLQRQDTLFPVYYKDLYPNRSSVRHGTRIATPAWNSKAVHIRDLGACQATQPNFEFDGINLCHLIPSRRGEAIAGEIMKRLQSRFYRLYPISRRPLREEISLHHPFNLVSLRSDIHERWDSDLLALMPFPNLAFDRNANPLDNEPQAPPRLERSRVLMISTDNRPGRGWLRESIFKSDDSLWPPEAVWSYAFAATLGRLGAQDAFKEWSSSFLPGLRRSDERHTGTDTTRPSYDRSSVDDDEYPDDEFLTNLEAINDARRNTTIQNWVETSAAETCPVDPNNPSP